MAQFAAALAGECRVAGEQPVSGISIDSRSLCQGDAFFALGGAAHDGHEFVGAALDAGAAALVIGAGWMEKASQGAVLARKCQAQGAALCVVDEPLAALVRLASAARRRARAQVFAITGSVGKTGTKDMLCHVLSGFGSCHGAPASFNNHLGVALTLASLPAHADYCVCELGMNHSGEIAQLARLARPHIAVITAIEPAHMAHFNSLADIAQAKGEIFCGHPPPHTALVNRDTQHCADLVALARAAHVKKILTFSREDRQADFFLEESPQGADMGRTGKACAARAAGARAGQKGSILRLGTQRLAVHPPAMLALHPLGWVAAFAAAHEAGCALATRQDPFAGLALQRGRGESVMTRLDDGRRVNVIDDSYNANPASMRFALARLAAHAPQGAGRRIALLGEMQELGASAAQMHVDLRGPLMEAHVDRVYCAGMLMRALHDALPGPMRGGFAGTAGDLLPVIRRDLRDGDVLLVKGSRSVQLDLLVAEIAGRAAQMPARAARAGTYDGKAAGSTAKVVRQGVRDAE